MSLFKVIIVAWVLTCCVGCERDATSTSTEAPTVTNRSAAEPPTPEAHGVVEQQVDTTSFDISNQLGTVIPWPVTLGVTTIEGLVEQAQRAQSEHDVSGLAEPQALLVVATPVQPETAELAFEGRAAADGQHPVTAVFVEGRDGSDLCERYRPVYFDEQGRARFDCDVPPIHGDTTWRACGGGQGRGPRISVECRKIPEEGEPGSLQIFLLPAGTDP